jgi:hypothetical protein
MPQETERAARAGNGPLLEHVGTLLMVSLPGELDCHDLEKGMARAPCLPLFAIGVDPRFDYFPGVVSLDNLVFLRRTASQFRKAKP